MNRIIITVLFVLIGGLGLGPMLEAQERESEPLEGNLDYVLVERRDQNGEFLSRSLRPVISREERETLKFGKIDYSILSLNYEGQNARVRVDGREIDVPIQILISNRVIRDRKTPTPPKPGETPNRFKEKRTQQEIEAYRKKLFDKMEERRQERVPADTPAKDPSRPANP